MKLSKIIQIEVLKKSVEKKEKFVQINKIQWKIKN